MKEKKISVTKNSMNFGAITGITLFIVFIAFNLLRIAGSGIQQGISYLVIGFGIWWGTKSFRDNVQMGHISYSKALSSGTLICFFCSLIIAFLMYIYLKFGDDSLIKTTLEAEEAKLIEQGMDDEQIEYSMKVVRKISTPIGMSIITVIWYTFIGFLISLLVSAFVKKEDDSYDHFIEENQ